MPSPDELDDDLPNDQATAPTDADGNAVEDDAPGPIDVPDTGAPDDDSIEMQDDGSAVVQLEGDEAPASGVGEFFANLAEVIDGGILDARSRKLVEMIERDMQARQDRDKQYAEGIKRTGMGGEAPGGADFEGASRTVHPVLTEGCIDFSAKAMKEIFPPNGPCRTQIVGKQTPEKIDKAERKRQYMNWQLQHQIPEYRSQTETTLTQLPLGGSQYKNWWYDHDLGRPAVEFVPIDYVVLPAGAQDFYACQRITHIQDITEETYARRVDSNYYTDIDVTAPGSVPEETASSKASAKVEGVQPDPYNQDGLRRIYVVNVTFEAFDADDETHGEPAPYMWHIDESTGRTLALYRNWDPEDKKRERMHWLVDHTFIRWRGPQGVGLLHIIGSMSGAITGGIRSVLDHALAENSMSGVKLKGGKVSGTTENPAVGETVEMEGPTGGSVDDIRKLYMPYPFNPQSPLLFNVLQWLVEQARGVVQVASEKLADGKTDMPVGSTLALIEQGSSVFSNIHSGLHASQGQELKILHRLNKWYLQDKETVAELGDLVVEREDFEGPCDIIPVSDPLIFSETQRYAQMQAIHGLMANPAFAPKFKVDRVLDRTLELLHIQNWDDMIKVDPEPEDLDPVSENMVVALGEQPVKAFNFQDHMAHLLVHLHFVTSPMFGSNPMLGPKIVPALMTHCMEHIVYQYVNHSVAAAAAGEAMGLPATSKDDRFAVTMSMVDRVLSSDFQELGQMFQTGLQMAMKFMQQANQPPMDPAAQATIQVGMAEIQRKGKDDEARQKLEQTKLASGHMLEDQRMKQEQAALQSKEQVRQAMDQMIQSQKDQREQDRLAFEERKVQATLYNQQLIESMKEGMETHRQNLQQMTEALINSLAPLGQIPGQMAESVRAAVPPTSPAPPEAPPMPDYSPMLEKMASSIDSLHQAHQQAQQSAQSATAAQQHALAQLVGALQSSHADLSGRLQQNIAGLQQALAQHLSTTGAQQSDELARAMEMLHELADTIEDSSAAQSGEVKAAFNKLQKVIVSPRIRELRRDKQGKKFAVDRPAKDGEV